MAEQAADPSREVGPIRHNIASVLSQRWIRRLGRPISAADRRTARTDPMTPVILGPSPRSVRADQDQRVRPSPPAPFLDRLVGRLAPATSLELRYFRCSSSTSGSLALASSSRRPRRSCHEGKVGDVEGSFSQMTPSFSGMPVCSVRAVDARAKASSSWSAARRRRSP